MSMLKSLHWLKIDTHTVWNILRTKHDVDNRASALEAIRGLLRRLKISWTLVHKRPTTTSELLPTNHLSSTTSQLNGQVHWKLQRSPIHFLKMAWTLVLEQLKIGSSILLPGFADGDQQTELNQPLPSSGQ